MFFALYGTMVIAGIIGYLAEKTRFTRNGIIPSIVICIGGAVFFYFFVRMFGIGFRQPGINAIISAIGALIIVPTHWRRK